MRPARKVRRSVTKRPNTGRNFTHPFISDSINHSSRAAELADFAKHWLGSFRRSFPDMEMKLVEIVAEGDTVVGRFACSATHLGEWRSHPPTGRRFETVDGVYLFILTGDRIARMWGIENTLDRFQQLRLDPST